MNNCLTANKKYEIDYDTVLGTVGFSNGSGGHSKHDWEIKIYTPGALTLTPSGAGYALRKAFHIVNFNF